MSVQRQDTVAHEECKTPGDEAVQHATAAAAEVQEEHQLLKIRSRPGVCLWLLSRAWLVGIIASCFLLGIIYFPSLSELAIILSCCSLKCLLALCCFCALIRSLAMATEHGHGRTVRCHSNTQNVAINPNGVTEEKHATNASHYLYNRQYNHIHGSRMQPMMAFER